jgi:two-component system, sensor histidine kinase
MADTTGIESTRRIHWLHNLAPGASLRSRLGLTFGGIALLMALVLSISAGLASTARLREERGKALHELAFQMSDKLDRGMFERYRDMQIATGLAPIRDQQTSPATRRALLETLQRTYPDYAWIGFADLQGRVVASTGRLLEGADVSERPWFVAARSGPFVGDVHEAVLLANLLPNPGNEPLRFVDVAMPVTDEQGRAVGVLGAHLSWGWATEVQQSLFEQNTREDQIDIFVLNRDGQVLLGPAASSQPLISDLRDMRNGVSIVRWPDGQRYLTSSHHSRGYRQYSGLGWIVVTRQPEAVAFAPASALQTQILLTGIGFGLLCMLLGWFAASHIVRPLHAIADAAERMRHGDRDVLIPPPRGNDEIAQLGNALCQLIETLRTQEAELKALNSALEQRVATRTYELVSAKERLEHEIVERRAIEQTVRDAMAEAERANRAKSEFLSRMSHELRTPLNAILGFGQLLELDPLEGHQREHVGYIQKAGQHLLQLIDEVLDISRIEAGRLPLSIEPIALDDLLHETRSLVAPLADRFRVTLLPLPPDLDRCHVLADRQRLKQVLLNLLTNAIKYNRPDGEVELSCSGDASDRLRIEVRDTGPGIAPDKLIRLFSPFDRLGAEHTDVEGTGLGLAISKRMVEAMDGSLHVSSVPGQGSTFGIELRVAEAPLERLDRLLSKPPFSPQPSEYALRVLYIEDNVSNIKLVERILEQRPQAQLLTAAQGRLGLTLAQTHRPDLVLLDLHLPDVSGDEVLRILRADPLTAHIPVIMISADATSAQAERLVALGARAYLTKPLNVQQLLSLVDQTAPGMETSWTNTSSNQHVF